MVTLIVQDLEYLLETCPDGLTLGEFIDFSRQLDRAGYTFFVDRNNSNTMIGFEEPTLIQRIQRIITHLTKKRLKLTKEQKFVFQKIPIQIKNKTINGMC